MIRAARDNIKARRPAMNIVEEIPLQDENEGNVTEATKDEKMDITVTAHDSSEGEDLDDEVGMPNIEMPFGTTQSTLQTTELLSMDEAALSEADLSEFNEDEADLISSDSDTQ